MQNSAPQHQNQAMQSPSLQSSTTQKPAFQNPAAQMYNQAPPIPGVYTPAQQNPAAPPAPQTQSNAPTYQSHSPVTQSFQPPPPPPVASPYAPPPNSIDRTSASKAPYAPEKSNTPPVEQPRVSYTTKAPTPAPKYPPGDRTHIPPDSRPIFDVFQSELVRISQFAPPQFTRQVKDTDKRLNILFDLLNNDDVLQPDVITTLVTIATGKFFQTFTNLSNKSKRLGYCSYHSFGTRNYYSVPWTLDGWCQKTDRHVAWYSIDKQVD